MKCNIFDIQLEVIWYKNVNDNNVSSIKFLFYETPTLWVARRFIVDVWRLKYKTRWKSTKFLLSEIIKIYFQSTVWQLLDSRFCLLR